MLIFGNMSSYPNEGFVYLFYSRFFVKVGWHFHLQNLTPRTETNPLPKMVKWCEWGSGFLRCDVQLELF